jgi:hypothetical protein
MIKLFKKTLEPKRSKINETIFLEKRNDIFFGTKTENRYEINNFQKQNEAKGKKNC